MAHAEFQVGELTARVGDNASAGDGDHRAGYNGIWTLRHRSCERSIFVPGVAGLNFEHIFDGETDDQAQAVFFEPRHAPMTLGRVSATEAELHQPPTPTFRLESWTRFRFSPPHYVDMEFRCTPHQHVFRRGYIGLFWASYIHAPEDRSLYFRGMPSGGRPSWTQLCTQFHNDQSTVRHRDDRVELEFRQANRPSLFRSFSSLRFEQPFYYGRFENLVYILMFDRAEGIRFTHSPSGGGFDQARDTSNPAWDWQFIIPRYDVMRSYRFRARAVLRPACPRREVLEEYRRWSASLRPA